jgi:uncharacterized membrane protein
MLVVIKMKKFRYIFGIIVILVLGSSFSIFKRKIGLGFINDNTMITFAIWLIFFLSILSIRTSLKNFNKKKTSSFILMILSFAFFIPFGYGVSISIRKQFYRLKITNEFNLENFQLEKIEDSTDVEILSYTNAYSCTTEKTFYYSVVCVIKKSNDTIRLLSACQLFSKTEKYATISPHSSPTEELLDSLNLNFYANSKKYILIDRGIPFQDGNYKVVLGTIGYEKNVDGID